MTVSILCPSCGAWTTVPDQASNQAEKYSCSGCGQQLPTTEVTPADSITEVLPADDHVPAGLPADTGEPITVRPTSYVTFLPGPRIEVSATTAAEAKLAIQELRAKRKEQTLAKRYIMQQQREVRAAYTSRVRTQGSMFRGGGWFGKIIRARQTGSRDAARSRLAAELAPLESRRAGIELTIGIIDHLIIRLQNAIQSRRST